ncbi:hypothetical protein [Desulfovermiculus halophilus]|uniref:hypothetical protein n=1 Tax=Desulfovermiculus halophilus TaxID=339722 RepID=UPI000487EB8A|nr:hypothetical protein [Desulfovermiculus halophilus]
MPDVDVHKAELLSPFIGQDFLTWLWFCTETGRGTWTLATGETVLVSMTQRVAVQGGEGESRDTATSAGPQSRLQEARLGLRTGKKVNQARIHMEMDDHAWQVQLRAEDFALSGLRTPKVELKVEEGEDPDARFLEKMYLIDKCLEVIDLVFVSFVQLRLGSAWAQEAKGVKDWIFS